MTEDHISLDNWVSVVAQKSDGDTRQLLSFFQRDWTQGHLTNPLLFPLQQLNKHWRTDFEWFVTVENFKVDIPCDDESAPPKDSVTGKETIEKDVEARTIIFDQEHTMHDAPSSNPETDLAESASLTSAPDGSSEDADHESDSDLDDLGTLIMESQKEQKEETISDSPQTAASGKRKIPPKNASPELSIQETVNPEAISSNPTPPKAPAPRRIKSTDASAEAGKKKTAAPASQTDPRTETMQTQKPRPPKPSPAAKMDKTVIVQESSQSQAADEGKMPKPESESDAPGLDLDFDDLDTMVWLDNTEEKN